MSEIVAALRRSPAFKGYAQPLHLDAADALERLEKDLTEQTASHAVTVGTALAAIRRLEMMENPMMTCDRDYGPSLMLTDEQVLAWQDRNFFHGQLSASRLAMEDAATIPQNAAVHPQERKEGDEK